MSHYKFARKITLKTVACVIIIFILTVLVILAASASHTSRRQSAVNVDFYFMGINNAGMQSEGRKIQGIKEEEILSSVLVELKNGPKVEGLQPSIPDDVLFHSAMIREDTVLLDMSKEYLNMKNGEEVICRSSIVWTLTSLNFIEDVIMTVDGEELVKSNGEPIGPMSRQNVVINANIAPESKRYETVKLYFANRDGTALVSENREIEVSQNQTKEKSVMEQLIAGPREEHHLSTISSDTKLRDITTTEDGVCYVNLSDGFLSKYTTNEKGEYLMVYSIVNSLTSLPRIKKVQFLIEGEKIEELQGNLDYSKPFEENIEIGRAHV